MNLFRSTAVVLALTSGLLALPAHAEVAGGGAESKYTNANAPKAWSMAADLLIARPVLIAATVVGAGLFVVTLPFSAAGGNIGEAGHAFVVEPGKSAFVRCLGCTTTGYKRD